MHGLSFPKVRRDHKRELLNRIAETRQVGDDGDLTCYLNEHWTDNTLMALLGDLDDRVVQAAAAALGLVGGFGSTGPVSALLHHDDFFVVMAAENALWNIWFRASTPNNTRRLKETVRLIQAEEYDQAARTLSHILDDDGRFAEAHNQQAVLHYMTGEFERSLLDCFKARAQNPWHFGAAAGIGHNLLQLGRYDAAIDAYRRAMRMHPRMAGVRQALRQARALLDNAPSLSHSS